MNLLEASHLGKTFNPQTPAAIRAVSDISLTLKAGEILMIMGPSGSGKTTLLTLIGGLLSPTQGRVTLNDVEITSLARHHLTAFRRHNLGFIFQSFNLLENLTALENVVVAGFGPDARESALRLLCQLGLKKRLGSKPRELSGGERQRVAIARALINNPLLLLADEPTANLDRAVGHEVMTLLCSIACEKNKGLIIVSHDERIKDTAHRVLYIEDGVLVGEEKGRHDEVCRMQKHQGVEKEEKT